MKNFFLSLKTTVWTLLALVLLFFIGSYLMPLHREIFAPMNDNLLVTWIRETAEGNLVQTWWFFAALAGLMLLTINTIVCSIQALRGKWSGTEYLLRISPQIVHIGFLFILLAHLLSAGWGYKLSGMMPEGASARLPGNRTLTLQEIRVIPDSSGALRDWAASIMLYENGAFVKSGVLGPNHPVFYGGTAVYLKTLDFDRGPAAYLMVVKDPGALWALIGGILFLAGSFALLVLKFKKS